MIGPSTHAREQHVHPVCLAHTSGSLARGWQCQLWVGSFPVHLVKYIPQIFCLPTLCLLLHQYLPVDRTMGRGAFGPTRLPTTDMQHIFNFSAEGPTERGKAVVNGGLPHSSLSPLIMSPESGTHMVSCVAPFGMGW